MSDFTGIVSDKFVSRQAPFMSRVTKPTSKTVHTRPVVARRRPVAPRAGVRRLKSEHVADVLGVKIVSGVLAPGALLPTEAELARELGISRPSLREGLRALAQKGLVEGRTRRGTTVNARTRWNVLDPDVLRWLAEAPPDPAFFMDLLDVRAIVEPAAARLAAARATPAQILAMEAAWRGMVETTPHDMERCCVHDLALHELIIMSTGNQILIRFAGAIRTALLYCVRIASSARDVGYEKSLAEHHAVVAAVRRRDPDEAEQAMRKLLAGTVRDLAPAYDKYPHGLPPPRAAKVARRSPRRA